jgi:hypothetical protein
MRDTDWKVEKAESRWLQLQSEVSDDGTHWWRASVKWDGCVDLHRAHNVPFGADGRQDGPEHMAFTSDMHIYDLDDFIESLLKMRDAAKKHYGNDWP